jgi:hypothetical protein
VHGGIDVLSSNTHPSPQDTLELGADHTLHGMK